MTSSNKTDRYIKLILTISNSRGFRIPDSKFREILGNPSKAQYHKYVIDLTTESIDRPAIVERIKEGDNYIYKLNQDSFRSFVWAQKEGAFMIECYKHLGKLITSDIDGMNLEDYEEINTKSDLDRKFFYLSKVQAKKMSKEKRDKIDTIVKSLIANKKLYIRYNTKMYDIFPLTICQYRDELFLLAYKDSMKEENLRSFKVIRIDKVMERSDDFKYPSKKKWNPERAYKNTSGLIRGEVLYTVMRVYGVSRKLLKEKDFFGNELVSETDKYDEYKCSFTSIQEFLGQVFVYAQDIEIVSPEDLKSAFIKKAEAAISINSDKIEKKAA